MASRRRSPSSTKNLQVRLGPQAHETLKQLAELKQTSIADIIRDSIELYTIHLSYASKGHQLMYEDKQGAKIVVLIPGFNAPRAHLIESATATEH